MKLKVTASLKKQALPAAMPPAPNPNEVKPNPNEPKQVAPQQHSEVKGHGPDKRKALINGVLTVLKGAGLEKADNDANYNAQLKCLNLMATWPQVEKAFGGEQGNVTFTISPQMAKEVVKTFMNANGENKSSGPETGGGDKVQSDLSSHTEVTDVTIDGRPQWMKDRQDKKSSRVSTMRRLMKDFQF
jgi:hypothetical protein